MCPGHNVPGAIPGNGFHSIVAAGPSPSIALLPAATAPSNGALVAQNNSTCEAPLGKESPYFCHLARFMAKPACMFRADFLTKYK